MNSKPFGFNEFISRKEDSKISSRIKEDLLKNLEYFDSGTKFHLLSRLHSAYPGKGYSLRIQEIIPDLEKNLKDQLGKCLLEKNPSSSLEGIKLYTDFCISYFPLGRNNLMYLIDSDLLESALKYIRKHFYRVMEKMLSEEKIIIGLPASAPRNLYYAKSSNLIEDNDILHLEKLLLDSSRKMYTEEKLKDKKIFDNYIYFLTHVILGELNFYTSKLLDPSPEIKEMIDYLEKNSERIIKECSWDKVVEAGVCLKYCGRSPEVYKKAIKKILNKRGIIGEGGPFYEKKDLSYREETIQKEHSNVLAVLLFSDKN
jgi:hypothetical protein